MTTALVLLFLVYLKKVPNSQFFRVLKKYTINLFYRVKKEFEEVAGAASATTPELAKNDETDNVSTPETSFKTATPSSTSMAAKLDNFRDIVYPYPKLSYRKVLLDSFIWCHGISKGILVTFFNIAHAVKLFTI